MKRNIWIPISVFLAVSLPAVARTANIEVRWSELSPLILGQTVTLVLPGGTAISGQTVAVRDDVLVLDVRRTSDSKVQPKGPASIPRASVTTLQKSETKAVGGRVLGVVVGVLVGMVAGGEIVAHGDMREGPGVTTFTAVAVSGAVGGYYLGKSVDRRSTTIRVVP